MTIQKFVGMTVEEVICMANKAGILCTVFEDAEVAYWNRMVELEFDPATRVIISSTWVQKAERLSFYFELSEYSENSTGRSQSQLTPISHN